MNIKSSIVFGGHNECVHSDSCGLSTTNVEEPIEGHKSLLVPRETGDGLTGMERGGISDRTETVPKWLRERRARSGLREASRRDKAMHLSSLNHSLCPEMYLTRYNHINLQILITGSDRVVRGVFYVT